jgi:hypothetical protein
MKFKNLLVSVAVLLCLYSCKKESPAPSNPVLILGKWFNTKVTTKLYNNGAEVDSTNTISFTTDDFVEYYSDGSGYYSHASSEGPTLSEFTYTLKGAALSEFTSVENNSVPETITGLTATNLSIHAVSLVPDPNDPTITDTEIDDLSYKR